MWKILLLFVLKYDATCCKRVSSYLKRAFIASLFGSVNNLCNAGPQHRRTGRNESSLSVGRRHVSASKCRGANSLRHFIEFLPLNEEGAPKTHNLCYYCIDLERDELVI